MATTTDRSMTRSEFRALSSHCRAQQRLGYEDEKITEVFPELAGLDVLASNQKFREQFLLLAEFAEQRRIFPTFSYRINCFHPASFFEDESPAAWGCGDSYGCGDDDEED